NPNNRIPRRWPFLQEFRAVHNRVSKKPCYVLALSVARLQLTPPRGACGGTRSYSSGRVLLLLPRPPAPEFVDQMPGGVQAFGNRLLPTPMHRSSTRA